MTILVCCIFAHSQRKAFNWQNSAQLTNGLIRKFWGFLEHFEMEVFQVVLLDHPFLKDVGKFWQILTPTNFGKFFNPPP